MPRAAQPSPRPERADRRPLVIQDRWGLPVELNVVPVVGPRRSHVRMSNADGIALYSMGEKEAWRLVLDLIEATYVLVNARHQHEVEDNRE